MKLCDWHFVITDDKGKEFGKYQPADPESGVTEEERQAISVAIAHFIVDNKRAGNTVSIVAGGLPPWEE